MCKIDFRDTGLKDINGDKIRIGDILQFEDSFYEEYNGGYSNKATVVQGKGRVELADFENPKSDVKESMYDACHEDFISVFEKAKIIGNVHDDQRLGIG